MTTVLVVLLAVVVALLVVLVAGLLRSHAEILRALHELGVDLDPDRAGGADVTQLRPVVAPDTRRESRQAADIAGQTPSGDAVSFSIVGAPQPTMVAFLTSGCATCTNFWSAFVDSRNLAVPGDGRLVVVTKGAEAESPARLAKFVSPGLSVVMSTQAWDDYDVPVAPYFAYVDGESGTVVGEGAGNTWEHVVSMCEQAASDAGMSPSRGRRRRRPDGREREARVDTTLREAGIEPGHPSLYPRDVTDLHAPSGE